MEPRYDVALSFAGEQRPYVEKLAGILREAEIKVFYDDYEKTTLWGKNLYSHLDHIYREASRYCIIFISKAYANKVWTNHERQSAQARALAENGEYVLPVRFDDTEIPGLLPTIGYLDASSMSPGDLAALVKEKLGPGEWESKSYTIVAVGPIGGSEEKQWVIRKIRELGHEATREFYALVGKMRVKGRRSRLRRGAFVSRSDDPLEIYTTLHEYDIISFEGGSPDGEHVGVRLRPHGYLLARFFLPYESFPDWFFRASDQNTDTPLVSRKRVAYW